MSECTELAYRVKCDGVGCTIEAPGGPTDLEAQENAVFAGFCPVNVGGSLEWYCPRHWPSNQED